MKATSFKNSKTHRHIQRYTNLIDRLLVLWKTKLKKGVLPDNNLIFREANEAEFYHYKLGIDKLIKKHNDEQYKLDDTKRRFISFSGELINPNIQHFYKDLSQYSHDKERCKNISEQIDLRNEHVEKCRELAMSIAEPIDDLELGPEAFTDLSNVEEDVSKFCYFADELIAEYEGYVASPGSSLNIPNFAKYGLRMNDLGKTLGIYRVDFDWELGHFQAFSAEEAAYNTPFVLSQWDQDVMLGGGYPFDRINILKDWQERAKQLLQADHAD